VVELKLVEIKPAHVFFGLIIFWSVWLYTEYVEREQRLNFEHAFDAFHNEGARFTAEDGDKLKERIDVQRQIIIALHTRVDRNDQRLAELDRKHSKE
jgi:hypothetical protein